jgi:hypothetical protein
MILWKEIYTLAIVSTILFSLITHYGSDASLASKALVFALALLVISSAAKYYTDKNKEQFFFEVSPYKKCSQKGFYGRPLSFDYTLPECETECNPY